MNFKVDENLPCLTSAGVRRGWLPAALGPLLLAALLPSACGPARPLRISSPRAELAAAPGATPGVEGRLTGASREPWALADDAVGDLRHQRFKVAVAKLEEATTLARRDARLTSDLAVAYLACAAEHPKDYALALDAADRSLATAPSSPEARFNRALALEHLFLRGDARRAWKDYLLFDPGSPWATEAKRHLRHLEEPSPRELWERQGGDLERAATAGDRRTVRSIVVRFPQAVCEYLEEVLLPRWAEARVQGNLWEADRLLQAVRVAGTELAAFNGEHMAEDAVQAIERAGDGADGRLAALVEGHRLYGRARPMVDRHGAKEAWPLLGAARAALIRGGSPLAAWASVQMVVCRFDGIEPRQIRAELEELRRDPAAARAPSLRGRIEWLIGFSQLGGADPAAGLAGYQRALGIYEASREVGSRAMMETLLAEGYRSLGDERTAWTFRYQSLASLGEVASPRRRQAILDEVARSLIAQGQLGPALYFYDRSLDAARELGDPVSLADAFLKRGELRFLLGDARRATADLATALGHCAKITLVSRRQRTEADIRAAQGRLCRTTDPRGAIRDLSAALAFYRHVADHYRSVALYLTRALAHTAVHDARGAERDLDAGIAEYEAEREKVPGEQLRISYFDQARSIYDEMIRLQAEVKGRFDRALEYAERSRARGLLDRLGALPFAGERDRRARPLRAEEIRGAMPEREVLIEYAVLDDIVLSWSVRRGGIVPTRLEVGKPELATLVQRLRRALEDDRATEANALLAGLYDRLVRPLPAFAPGEAVVFVPDGSLNGLPFAALRNRESGHYLVEDHAVGVAPSATIFARCLQRDAAMDRAAEPDALIVSQPAFDLALFPTLQALPGTAREAASLARIYPRHEILAGAAATKANVLAALRRHTLIEFAGHSLTDAEFPLLSRLALAPGGGDSGSLYAHELYALQIERARLVVLSSCSSGAGEATPSEGVLSLARPFLAAGVPAVVASLWEVHDELTAQLLGAFHLQLRRGKSPLIALQSAQLELLHGPAGGRSPAAWAAFELFGGVLPK